MAVIDATRLAQVRQACAVALGTVTYTKPQINAAAQAVEDWFEANRASIGVAINTATVPLGITFTAAQKVQIVKYWLKAKFDLGG